MNKKDKLLEKYLDGIRAIINVSVANNVCWFEMLSLVGEYISEYIPKDHELFNLLAINTTAVITRTQMRVNLIIDENDAAEIAVKENLESAEEIIMCTIFEKIDDILTK